MKQLRISVPPHIEARLTSDLILEYTKSNDSGIRGDPVEAMTRTWSKLGGGLINAWSSLTLSMNFADTPKKVPLVSPTKLNKELQSG